MTKNYVVALEATSYKEVPIFAASEEAALELAHEMYFSYGELEFSDDDVIEITAGIKADDTNEASEVVSIDELEALCDIVRFICALWNTCVESGWHCLDKQRLCTDRDHLSGTLRP